MQLPIEDPHWYRNPDRACLNAPTNDFYEPAEGTTAAAREFAAQLIHLYCRPCPVRVDCLSSALNDEGDLGGKNRHGIQGGMTPEQRAVRARALRKTIVHGTYAGYKAHRRRSETACDECKAAKRIRESEWKAS